MAFTDDPIDDFNRYDAERERKLNQLPKCIECEEPIQDDFCFEIDGEYVCEECMNNYHRISTDSICGDW